MSTRDRIIAAATEMMQEGAPRLSVRAVAARAGVGASTLRHHFPTQRDLINAALTATYDAAMPDERIRDTSMPARERLRECLRRLLDPFAEPAEARDVWTNLLRMFAEAEADPKTRAGYQVLVDEAERRISAWLAILEEEGALPPGDNATRSDFLLTFVDGLSIARALPPSDQRLEDETRSLAFAVDAVFDVVSPARPPQ
ncbi:TetR family transcriptional regulator [Microbacterium aerolatum]|uniref:TetR family transcriptional regulator n=1 Tax=Microbacterium aerolatum TaxID=153731 RepID=UPI0020017DFA|nr:TetR family transcriptional regulator [Microbacterium aerolatum]MCK3769323.1 TetR family transcriptional regulator [Microbacterium aerolatum]